MGLLVMVDSYAGLKILFQKHSGVGLEGRVPDVNVGVDFTYS